MQQISWKNSIEYCSGEFFCSDVHIGLFVTETAKLRYYPTLIG